MLLQDFRFPIEDKDNRAPNIADIERFVILVEY